MQVKNTKTGVKIDKSTAYITMIGKKKCFFSNVEEYMEYIKDKELRKTLGNKYVTLLEEFIDLSSTPKTYVIAKRHMNLLIQKYDLPYIDWCLERCRFSYADSAQKPFTTINAKYAYFYKILVNTLGTSQSIYMLDQKKSKNNLKSDELYDKISDGIHYEKKSINEFIDDDL